MQLAREASQDGGLLLVLISGGGSALFALPAEGINLQDKMHTIKVCSRLQYVCVCVCIYIYIYIYMYVYTRAYTYMHTHIIEDTYMLMME